MRTEAQREQDRLAGKLRRERYTAEGRCIQCGKPSAGGLIRCERHLAMSRRPRGQTVLVHQRAASKERRQARREAGVCTRCGGARAPGLLICAAHAERHREACKRAYRKRCSR